MHSLAITSLIDPALLLLVVGAAFEFSRRRAGDAEAADDGRTDSAARTAGTGATPEGPSPVSPDKYRIMVENANDAICVAQDGMFKFFNRKLQELLGYDAEFLATTPFVEMIAPEDRPLVVDRYTRRLRGEEVPQQYEFRFLTADGRRLWVEISSVAIDWEGQPAALSFMRSVNEQKRTETALRDAEARYHSLVESLPLSIFRKDAQCRIVFGNRRFCESLGRSLDDLRGKDDFDLFPRELAEKYRHDDLTVLATGRVIEDVERYRLADGETIYIQILKAPVLDAEGAIRGVQGMFLDVSARHRAEEQLREHAERTRLIIDTAYDAFISVDSAGRIVDWNPQAETMFGYSRDEALGRPTAELIIPLPSRESYLRLEHALARGQGGTLSKRIELTMMRRDGSQFPVEAAITPLRLGSTHLFHAFLQDISVRKRHETELREAKDAAEAANRAKSAFLANMSHEIRTPMNAVIGMAELVLDTPLNSEQREYLKLVLESADSLLSIINDLLDFSKIEAGKFDLDPVPFDIHECLGDTVKSLAVRAHKKGLELVHEIASDVPNVVVGDPNRLRQVVVNLVGNAIKFTDRGEVVVTVNRQSADPRELVLSFAVRDTGIGIPANMREIIFRAFEQADSSTTRRYGGTGLGLAISTALVDLMGGRLWVDSEVGRGSTFHFTARLRPAAEADVASHVSAAAPLEGLRVLVVDDNSTNRRVQWQILTNWRMKPVAVSSAAEALAVLTEAAGTGEPFRLVLTDANMPEVDGFELVAHIKNNPALHGAIIMMLTSGDRPDDVARCRELGIAAYLRKPIKQSELFDAIAAALAPALAESESSAPVSTVHIKPLRVLLAEDSLINQKLTVGLLARAGHDVMVANNGREALAALETHAFDLVLMDVQMPEMDGLDATRALRSREASARLTRTPVIAMTAHAMPGDRERCLEAGTDGYISKPIRAATLFETIAAVVEEVTRPAAPAAGATAPFGASAAASVDTAATVESAAPVDSIDYEVALATCGGDRQLLYEIVEAFCEEGPRLLADLRRAAAEGNADGLRAAAHTLKSSLRYLGVEMLHAQALALETAGREGRMAEATASAGPFADRLDALVARIVARTDNRPS